MVLGSEGEFRVLMRSIYGDESIALDGEAHEKVVSVSILTVIKSKELDQCQRIVHKPRFDRIRIAERMC